MTILITGAAGFIGSHLARVLLGRGDRVLAVDNFNDYYDPQLKRDRMAALLEDFDDIEVFEVDLSDYKAMEGIFKKNQIDKVCNLAAQAGVRYSLTNPHAYVQANIVGFVNLLELCRMHKVNDFIYASSSSVYGKNKNFPFSEDQQVDTPISLYAASKKSNEEMAHVYHHLFGLNCTGLRFFTVYGPWGRPDMALSIFTKAILAGEPINVFNNGEMARDFTYVDDIVSGVVAALDASHSHEVFNLARGESVKLMDYIKAIEENLGLEAKKNMMPLQDGDVPVTTASIDRAKDKLDYNPQTSVPEGVKRFVEWYRGYYNV